MHNYITVWIFRQVRRACATVQAFAVQAALPLCASSLVAARLAAEGVDASAAVEAGAPDVTGGRLLGSAPVLQNAAETSIGESMAGGSSCGCMTSSQRKSRLKRRSVD